MDGRRAILESKVYYLNDGSVRIAAEPDWIYLVKIDGDRLVVELVGSDNKVTTIPDPHRPPT